MSSRPPQPRPRGVPQELSPILLILFTYYFPEYINECNTTLIEADDTVHFNASIPETLKVCSTMALNILSQQYITVTIRAL